MSTELFPVGTLVMTPLGRPARVVKHVYGKRGDVPRCIVRYIDSARQSELRLVPSLLTKIEFGVSDAEKAK